MHISKDSKLNSEEEEKVKLTIMPEKDWPCKIKTNTTPPNTDLSQDSPITNVSVKLFIQPLMVTKLLPKLNPPNLKNSESPTVWLTTLPLMPLVFYAQEDSITNWDSIKNIWDKKKLTENITILSITTLTEKPHSKLFWMLVWLIPPLVTKFSEPWKEPLMEVLTSPITTKDSQVSPKTLIKKNLMIPLSTEKEFSVFTLITIWPN